MSRRTTWQISLSPASALTFGCPNSTKSSASGAGYTELRWHANHATRLTMRKGALLQNSQSREGASRRAAIAAEPSASPRGQATMTGRLSRHWPRHVLTLCSTRASPNSRAICVFPVPLLPTAITSMNSAMCPYTTGAELLYAAC
jgi:hypothetical protein